MSAVTQDWTHDLTMMQQTVLLTSIRGPDGVEKYGSVKMLQRWLRRCILKSAMDGRVLTNPMDTNGGSFTGPSLGPEFLDPRVNPADPENPENPLWAAWHTGMDRIVDDYMRAMDGIPFHFHMHLMHTAEILGYKHPDKRIKEWWRRVYFRLTHSLHLHPEMEGEMDARLGDSREGWLKRADPATVA